jgi:hypothetical protein
MLMIHVLGTLGEVLGQNGLLPWAVITQPLGSPWYWQICMPSVRGSTCTALGEGYWPEQAPQSVVQICFVIAWPGGIVIKGVIQMISVFACTTEGRNRTVPMPPNKMIDRHQAAILRMIFSFLMYARDLIS